jgi:hypothetical protein
VNRSSLRGLGAGVVKPDVKCFVTTVRIHEGSA